MLKLKRSFANLSQDEIPELSLDLSYPQKAAPSCHQAANFTPFRFEPADDIDETRMLRPAKRQRFFVRQTVPEALVQLQQQNETPQQLLQQQQQQQQLKGPRDSCFKAPEEVGLGKSVEVIDAYKKHKYKKNKEQKIVFTEEDVKSILEFREQQLRLQYDAILQERLQEQFSYFSQFNQDYIHRTFKSSDFSYAS